MENNVWLMQGDCLERMKEIADGSVHCLISDIPYGIDFAEWDIKHSNNNSALLGASPAQQGKHLFKTRGKPKNGWSEADRQRPIEFQKFCEQWLSEAFRVLKPCGSVVCFTGRQFQHRFTIAAENVGFVYKDTIAWDKTKAPFRAQNIDKVLERRGVPATGKALRLGTFAPVFEPIVWCFKPYKVGTTITDAFIEHGTGLFDSSVLQTNILISKSNIDDRLHETQKPEHTMNTIIQCFTLDGQVVLDPFMGSGTTGVACKNLNRKFIGIEKDEQYFNIAEKRITGVAKVE